MVESRYIQRAAPPTRYSRSSVAPSEGGQAVRGLQGAGQDPVVLAQEGLLNGAALGGREVQERPVRHLCRAAADADHLPVQVLSAWALAVAVRREEQHVARVQVAVHEREQLRALVERLVRCGGRRGSVQRGAHDADQAGVPHGR
jgi:hypothetical protein